MARFKNYSYSILVRSALVQRVLHDGRKLIGGTGCNRGAGSTTGEQERSRLWQLRGLGIVNVRLVMRPGTSMVPQRRQVYEIGHDSADVDLCCVPLGMCR